MREPETSPDPRPPVQVDRRQAALAGVAAVAGGVVSLTQAQTTAAGSPPGAALPSAPVDGAVLDLLRAQVFAAERAFARSMAERDLAAFAHQVSEQALFFAGDQVLRGKPAVVAGWRRFYEGKEAPFSWEPDQVEVLADGSLALSTGPVRGPAGKLIGRFNSIWRQETPNVWRVVFDKGSPPDPGAA